MAMSAHTPQSALTNDDKRLGVECTIEASLGCSSILGKQIDAAYDGRRH
jgi:hypothetical protein